MSNYYIEDEIREVTENIDLKTNESTVYNKSKLDNKLGLRKNISDVNSKLI